MSAALSWVVPDQQLLFQEFGMLRDVEVSESQEDAGPRACAPWKLCREETLEETEPVSPGKPSALWVWGETDRQGQSVKGEWHPRIQDSQWL